GELPHERRRRGLPRGGRRDLDPRRHAHRAEPPARGGAAAGLTRFGVIYTPIGGLRDAKAVTGAAKSGTESSAPIAQVGQRRLDREPARGDDAVSTFIVSVACDVSAVVGIALILDRDLPLRVRRVDSGNESASLADFVLSDWFGPPSPTN